MLNLISDPPDGRWSYQKRLIDDGRQIIFAPLGTLARGTVNAFLLTWKGRVIPVTASAREYQDEGGQRYLVFSHVNLNGAGMETAYGIAAFSFTSRQERAEAEMIAVECVLAFAKLAQAFKAIMAAGDHALSEFLPETAQKVQRGLE